MLGFSHDGVRRDAIALRRPIALCSSVNLCFAISSILLSFKKKDTDNKKFFVSVRMLLIACRLQQDKRPLRCLLGGLIIKAMRDGQC